jgi:hypothetical protein
VLELTGDKFGAFDPKTWQALHDLYANQKLLGSDVELDGKVYSGKYLPSN